MSLNRIIDDANMPIIITSNSSEAIDKSEFNDSIGNTNAAPVVFPSINEDINENEFDDSRYALGELIKSEEVFSRQADDAATIIGNILSECAKAQSKKKSNPFKLTDDEIELLQQAQTAFKAIANGRDIWRTIGGPLTIEYRNITNDPFVNQPIEAISLFLDTLNKGLTKKEDNAPFNQRIAACLYLSNNYEILLQLFNKKIKAHRQIDNLLITPIQRVARWTLFMNGFMNTESRGTIDRAFQKCRENGSNYFDEVSKAALTETIQSLKRKFARQAMNLDVCQGKIQEIKNKKALTASLIQAGSDEFVSKIPELMAQSFIQPEDANVTTESDPDPKVDEIMNDEEFIKELRKIENDPCHIQLNHLRKTILEHLNDYRYRGMKLFADKYQKHSVPAHIAMILKIIDSMNKGHCSSGQAFRAVVRILINAEQHQGLFRREKTHKLYQYGLDGLGINLNAAEIFIEHVRRTLSDIKRQVIAGAKLGTYSKFIGKIADILDNKNLNDMTKMKAIVLQQIKNPNPIEFYQNIMCYLVPDPTRSYHKIYNKVWNPKFIRENDIAEIPVQLL